MSDAGQQTPGREGDHQPVWDRRRIGPRGTAARVIVGLSLLGSVTYGHVRRRLQTGAVGPRAGRLSGWAPRMAPSLGCPTTTAGCPTPSDPANGPPEFLVTSCGEVSPDGPISRWSPKSSPQTPHQTGLGVR